MKLITKIANNIKSAEKLVARFGNARLVVNRNGRYELLGGNRYDRAQALEWISLFMHEATPIIKSDENNSAA
ncbi:MAG: hypothetical protein ACP5MG_14285 [Verrucomicrobiia bacterium]|jgi:hypothetical protein